MFVVCTLAALLGAAPVEKEKPLRPYPQLGKAPVVDGVLSEWAGADLKVAKAAAPKLSLKAGFKKDVLYVAGTAPGAPLEGTTFTVSLFFPTAGTTARGVRYLVTAQGVGGSEEDALPWARALVSAKAAGDEKATRFELSVPAKALPRFPARGQLGLQLCVTLDTKGQEPWSSCTAGEMEGGTLKLPDELRKQLGLTPPSDVEGVEPRPHGWVGYAVLHYPTWVLADADLSPESLAELIAPGASVEPKSVALPIPRSLALEDGRPVFTVLTGKNPYVGDDCVALNELRMAMYVVKANQGARVLEWPAATCQLGRAMRFELTPEGQLIIGYTNGSTARFTFTGDHFERAELGAR